MCVSHLVNPLLAKHSEADFLTLLFKELMEMMVLSMG